MSTCSSCNLPLKDKTDQVTTATGIMFHRMCLEQLLKPKSPNTDQASDTAASARDAKQCEKGGECSQINDRNHCSKWTHPDYCPDGGHCKNQQFDHLKKYRHLPLCSKSHKCIDYQKEVKEHCEKFRHFAPRCPYGNNCVDFHNKKHIDEFSHQYPTPCPYTPFHCSLYDDLTEHRNTRGLSNAVHQHCLNFAHVCRAGRNCTDTTQLHWSRSFHIARNLCPYGEKCLRLTDEEHLNSFTHPNILDIRLLCSEGDSCCDRANADHVAKFRHSIADETGVVPYYSLDKGSDFTKNHREVFERVKRYAEKNNWKPLPSGTIPNDILDWVRTVFPIHRCNPIIFESILLHGHVMSRDYMERLKNPKFVATSVLQHSRLRRIDGLKTPACENDARQYITALVCVEFIENNFTSAMTQGMDLLDTDTATPAAAHPDTKAFYQDIIKRKENRLALTIGNQDVKAIRDKTLQIAQASIKLHSNPAGIGHEPDKILRTDKHVFSILGPHQGHYYGDVIVIFKREILHHPDSNISMQAATTYLSGNAYRWRPWLGQAPGSQDERVKQYHATKLHAGVPGYDYALSAELIALTSLHQKLNSLDVSMKQILDRWTSVDSHQTVEAHLPQLIPLEYIDHVYIPKNIYENLSEDAMRAIGAVFRNRISVAEQIVEPVDKVPTFVARPPAKMRAEYQDTCIHTLLFRYKKYTSQLVLNYHRGITMTIRPTNFEEHYVLPLTIRQAYEHYRIMESDPSTANTTYIYWKAANGDMMITLSNEEISPTEHQPNLRSLICYVAPKPSVTDDNYHEASTYLSAGHPFQHETIVIKKTYKIKSNHFYMGCNVNDFFTYCLEIHRGSGHIVLSHAGPNGIYNHNAMVCVFSRSELDLTTLNFVHVSAGKHKILSSSWNFYQETFLMKTKRFRCGRLRLNQTNGIIEKLELENGGGSRYCHWFGKQMTFVQVHRQIRKVYGLSDPQIRTKLYDYQKQPLDTEQYRTFHDYIDRNGLSGNSIAIYLYTCDEDVDNDVISNVLSSKEIIPYVDQSMNTFRMSHAIEYSFINEINRLKRYVRELMNENGIDNVLLQLFENFCTIYGYVFSILLPLQQQQNDPTNAMEITVYLNNLEKIYEIFESTKTLLHRNMSNYRRNRTYSTVRSTFFQFYNNVQILRNRWLRNDTRKIDSTLSIPTHSDERKSICAYMQIYYKIFVANLTHPEAWKAKNETDPIRYYGIKQIISGSREAAIVIDEKPISKQIRRTKY
ncbi:unnamed protein product [Adineta ricciae]|uniref:C3H1-type domain-containing protein n=1 Tax=Adineta ricciae TaxID=249248 RepID=A0A814L587_ADIRI|nr:unnamed protein product [Adineta ricciae]